MSAPHAAVRLPGSVRREYARRGSPGRHRRLVQMTTPVETAQRFVDAMLAGESREHLVAPGFRFAGEAFAGMILPLAEISSPDLAAERIAGAGLVLRFAPVEPARPGRAWVEVVWTHGVEHAHGSAGLQWVVFTVQDELMRELRIFQDREAARAFAFEGS